MVLKDMKLTRNSAKFGTGRPFSGCAIPMMSRGLCYF